MLSRKQKKIIFGVTVFLLSVIAIVFSNETSSLGTAFPNTKNQDNQVQGVSVIDDKENADKDENLFKVVKVVDGDTLDVEVNGKTERLRLIGIDTPETVDPRSKVQCFGIEASNKAKELLLDKLVSLEEDPTQGDRDKYKRLLRYVFLEDGTNFNLYMISEGFAHEYTYDEPYKYQTEFKQAEVKARENNKGLWSPETCSGNK